MLVLTARAGHVEEEVLIRVPPSGETRFIRVKVVQVDRNRVRIGYIADADIVEAAQLDDLPRPGEHCRDCWERKKGRCQIGMREEFEP